MVTQSPPSSQDPSTMNGTVNSDHPLFLHQTDHPGLILISKKLNGSDNYGSWKRSMVIALNAKNKMKFMNIMLKLMLKGLWDEFDALEAPYLCTCVCDCENGKENSERDQMNRLIQFLMGLDDSFANIRGQILLMQPLPTVVKAYTMVRQEEKQREGLLPRPGTTAVFATFGHTKDQCYKLVGYPIGHPLHGKFPAKPHKSQPFNQSTNRTVNMVQNQNDTAAPNTPSAQTPPTQNAQPNTPSDNHVAARIDHLQNQLNQDQNKRIAHGILCNGLYLLPSSKPTPTKPTTAAFNITNTSYL
nr:hypothetical protein [Tanacetum cinerariifolium]